MQRTLPSLLLAFFFLFALADLVGAQEEQVYATREQALRSIFPGVEKIVPIKRVLTAEELKSIEKRLRRRLDEGGFFTFVGIQRGSIVGYAFISREIGKFEPFTFMVGVNLDGTVRDTVVMVYREAQGAEIRHSRFRKQYKGKDLEDPIRVNRDIVNISGATLSCQSLSRGVRKILVVADELYLSKPESEVWAEIAKEDPEAVPKTVAPEKGPEPLRQQRMRMGTTCTVTVYDGDVELAQRAIDMAFDEIGRVESVVSDWKEDSELSRVNRTASGQPVGVSKEMIEIVAELKRLSGETNGAFDPTIRAVVDVWGFRGEPVATVPDADHLKELVSQCGTDNIQSTADARTMSFANDVVRLDPGAWGKGYALDRVAEKLRGLGITSALIDFGSTAIAIGSPPGQEGWAIAIRNPWLAEEAIQTVWIQDEAISTSGNYENVSKIGAESFGHILDPKTGHPVRGMASASVICKKATDADAYSTALFVLGVDDGGAWLNEREMAGLLMADEAGSTTFSNGSWRNRVKQ